MTTYQRLPRGWSVCISCPSPVLTQTAPRVPVWQEVGVGDRGWVQVEGRGLLHRRWQCHPVARPTLLSTRMCAPHQLCVPSSVMRWRAWLAAL